VWLARSLWREVAFAVIRVGLSHQQQPAVTPMKRDLYAEVSARIFAELEAGAAPWIKPWSATIGANVPCNAVSNRPYSDFHRLQPGVKGCRLLPRISA
jgi:hypothetical protein